MTYNATETDAEVSVTGEGDHTLTATAADPAGNTSAASAGFVYTLDTTAPAAPAIASVHGDSLSPAAGNDTTPAIVVSGVVEGDTVAISEGSTVLGSQPTASNLNYTARQTVPNLVAVKLGADGKLNLRNFFGSTHVVADVVGWYDTE